MSSASDANIWQKHLAPDETLVWAASVSSADRRKAATRARLSGWFSVLLFGGFALVSFYRFFEWAVDGDPWRSFGNAATGPIILLMGAGLSVLAIHCFRTMDPAPSKVEHYAITSERLLALDKNNRIADDMPASEYIDLFFDNSNWPTEIHVVRKDSDENFYIELLPDLRAVADRIRAAFPKDTAP